MSRRTIAMGVGDIKSTMVTKLDEFNGRGGSHNVRP